MISVLFVSLEATADVVTDGVPHGDDVAHQSEFGDTELDGDHCQHCCHGHSSTITSQPAAFIAAMIAGARRVDNLVDVRNFGQAPPTPPPNA